MIRTSNRPEYFSQCIKSILNQNYNNVDIIICYDKDESLNYLKKYNKIKYFKVYSTSKEHYKYNLYCNELLKKVKNGFIIFLDDDDELCHSEVLKTINNFCNDESILWKYFRPDKIIFPADTKNIILERLHQIFVYI